MADPAGLFEAYLGWCIRVAGRPAKASAAKNAKLRHALEQAHLEFLPEAFVALAWVNAAVGTLVAYLLVGLGALALAATGRALALPVLVVLLILPPLLGATLFVAQ